MILNRRRFLSVSAAAASTGLLGMDRPISQWRGHALGAEAIIRIAGDGADAQLALRAARDTVRRMERLFSLYDPTSALSQLNKTGRLFMPPEFARLMRSVDFVHQHSQGLFDPTIQPVFEALLKAGQTELEKSGLDRNTGWDKVRIERGEIAFDLPGMAMTLNGIAQGFATDRVSEVLGLHGFDDVTVNVGEYRIGSRSAALSVANQDNKRLAQLTLRKQATATTSSRGFLFANGKSHLIVPANPVLKPVWKTTNVVAETATIADGFSTALGLTNDTRLADRLRENGHVHSVLFEAADGRLFNV